MNRLSKWRNLLGGNHQKHMTDEAPTFTEALPSTPPGFFMILGCPRSGTTLLAQCLSANSKVFVPYETDILVPCFFILSRVTNEKLGKEMIASLIANSYYFEWSLGKHLSAKEVRQSVRQSEYSMASIFSDLFTLAGKKVGKPIVGDKSPNDMFHILALMQGGMLRQPIKIIHIVRDLRDVVTSLNQQNWVNDADEWFPRLWNERNLFLLEHMQNAPNYFFLRYEDFVADPVRWLRALCSFLGVKFEARMLDTAAFPDMYKAIPAHRNLHHPIGTQRVGQWEKYASHQQIQQYESQAKEALEKFGYV